jgi:hypothetical protein
MPTINALSGGKMSSANQEAHFIFVGGSPRSGTTLVQNILDSHPDIFGGPEFLHLPDIIALRSKLHRSIEREWITLFCNREGVDAKIRELIESLLLPTAKAQHVKFLSEKTPENILVFSELAELFPDAHFIHVVRDPRAIVASMLQVGARAKGKNVRTARYAYSLHEAIRYLKKSLDAGFKAGSAFPDKIHTVLYEKLVTAPEQEIRKICDYLDIDWQPAMLAPANQNHAGERAITVNSDELFYDRETYYSNPHSASLEKWKRTLSPAQQIAVIDAFKENSTLQAFGYDLSSSSLDVKSRIAGKLLNTASVLLNKLPHKVGRITRWIT